MMASTVEFEDPVNKTVEKVYCNISHKGKDNESILGSSTKLQLTW